MYGFKEDENRMDGYGTSSWGRKGWQDPFTGSFYEDKNSPEYKERMRKKHEFWFGSDDSGNGLRKEQEEELRRIEYQQREERRRIMEENALIAAEEKRQRRSDLIRTFLFAADALYNYYRIEKELQADRQRQLELEKERQRQIEEQRRLEAERQRKDNVSWQKQVDKFTKFEALWRRKEYSESFVLLEEMYNDNVDELYPNEKFDICSRYALCYYHGYGTDVDYGKAADLFEHGSRIGQGFSSFNLAKMYEFGKGVQKDLNYALMLYTRSKNDQNFRPEECRKAIKRILDSF